MMDKAFASDVVLFCYEGEGTRPLGVVLREIRNSIHLKDISIIIGSEGGFSPAEAKLMKESGALMIGLGKRILRAETAAIMSLSCLVYEFELT
jgi:16S rRNA (uracil1498-N3)-methyltransferase